MVYSDDKVGIPVLNEDLTFICSTDNIGSVTSAVDFEYVVSLSLDFTIDPSEATLTDTTEASRGQWAEGRLGGPHIDGPDHPGQPRHRPGRRLHHRRPAQTDALLLVRVDSDEEVPEHNETNTTFVQTARLVDVILVLDKSGSMSGTVIVSNGTETKLGVLKPSGPRRPGRHRASGNRDRWNIRVHDPRRRPGRRVPARPA